MDVLWQAGIEQMKNNPDAARAILDKSGLGDQLKSAFGEQPEEGTK
jgi:hypothetical protein